MFTNIDTMSTEKLIKHVREPRFCGTIFTDELADRLQEYLYDAKKDRELMVQQAEEIVRLKIDNDWLREDFSEKISTATGVLKEYADKDNWSESLQDKSIGAVKIHLELDDQWNGNSSHGWAIAYRALEEIEGK